uniref:Uncharacterized protein n=1 Tax=Opuntia streptacantha TaxID=393608 RepID=A0A7C9AVJ2_OPUST
MEAHNYSLCCSYAQTSKLPHMLLHQFFHLDCHQHVDQRKLGQNLLSLVFYRFYKWENPRPEPSQEEGQWSHHRRPNPYHRFSQQHCPHYHTHPSLSLLPLPSRHHPHQHQHLTLTLKLALPLRWPSTTSSYYDSVRSAAQQDSLSHQHHHRRPPPSSGYSSGLYLCFRCYSP